MTMKSDLIIYAAVAATMLFPAVWPLSMVVVFAAWRPNRGFKK